MIEPKKLKTLLNNFHDWEESEGVGELPYEEYNQKMIEYISIYLNYIKDNSDILDNGYTLNYEFGSIFHEQLNLHIDFSCDYIELERYDKYKSFYIYGIKENINIIEVSDFLNNLSSFNTKLQNNPDNLSMFPEFKINKL